jgi:DNA replication protein DnaC
MDYKKLITALREKNIIPDREVVKRSFGTRDECRDMFTGIFQAADPTVKDFKYYKAYDEVIDWMVDTEGKGLALFGSVGTGKSVILRFVIPAIFAGKENKILKVVGLPDFMEMDGAKLTECLNRYAVLIDEMGREPLAVDYGKKYEAVPVLIENCEIYNKLLFITSNATEQQIVARYGLHTFDRIRKLCKIVIITNKSSRG